MSDARWTADRFEQVLKGCDLAVDAMIGDAKQAPSGFAIRAEGWEVYFFGHGDDPLATAVFSGEIPSNAVAIRLVECTNELPFVRLSRTDDENVQVMMDVIIAPLTDRGLIANVEAWRSAFANARRALETRLISQEEESDDVHPLFRKCPGIRGTRWSADDEEHAWRVGCIHAEARISFNPPMEGQFRSAYLAGYRETTEDENLSNSIPER